MLSFQEIGSAAMLSRRRAGLANKKVIISLPGLENAVRLAMTKLVLPELGYWRGRRRGRGREGSGLRAQGSGLRALDAGRRERVGRR